MGRVRVALLGVSAVLLVLIGALGWRAHQGQLAERALRHRAVAERAFEEMERALSGWLAREEARPVEHYAFYLPGGVERSPLAGELEPFVVGAFQQDDDGALRAVGEPRDPALAGARGDWPPAETRRAAIARVKEAVNELWSRNAGEDLDASDRPRELGRANEAPERQAPGTTRALAGPGVDPAAPAAEGKLAKKESSSAYDVLQSLNRAGAERSDRKQKQVLARVEPALEAEADVEYGAPPERVIMLPPSRAPDASAQLEEAQRSLDALLDTEVDDLMEREIADAGSWALEDEARTQEAAEEAPPAPAGERSGFRAAESTTREQSRLGAADPRSRERAELGAADPRSRAAFGEAETFGDLAAASPPEARSAPAAPPAPPSAAAGSATAAAARSAAAFRDAPAPKRDRRAVRLTLDPMLGAPVGGELIVLYRTVLAEDRAYRQGLVLDRARLGDWLEEQGIAGSALAELAQLRFDASASAPPAPDTRYLFAHRFAEPFDALHAELALAALPGEDSSGALGALVAVLLAVGAAGLFAVHRTASVVLDYAERRGNFVAAVTHELKTPLTAIRMYAEMLRDDLVPDDAKRREYYGTITDESERLSRLVDNVLEFSKLEGGRRDLRLEVGAVGPVLGEGVEKLRAHAAREGFELVVEVDDALPAVRFDRDALLQVLYNLVDNAMKYARSAGDKKIVIEAREERGAVRVAVRDFGPGVARGQLEHLFEPFYRAESELTRHTKGTGIGLALVKELAERMGAIVSGANAEGGGFRVGLVFPVAQNGGRP